MVMITIIQLDYVAAEVFKSKKTGFLLLLVKIVTDHHMHSLVFTL